MFVRSRDVLVLISARRTRSKYSTRPTNYRYVRVCMSVRSRNSFSRSERRVTMLPFFLLSLSLVYSRFTLRSISGQFRPVYTTNNFNSTSLYHTRICKTILCYLSFTYFNIYSKTIEFSITLNWTLNTVFELQYEYNRYMNIRVNCIRVETCILHSEILPKSFPRIFTIFSNIIERWGLE